MKEHEVDKLIKELADLCFEAIEEDLGEPIDPFRLAINDVRYDEESGTLEIDWDYEDKDQSKASGSDS